MNVRERAAADMKKILESGGSLGEITIHFNDKSIKVSGDVSDLDRLLEKNEGHIQTREASFSYSLLSLTELPEKGNKVGFNELAGKPITLYVSRVEVDRTIGICRLILSTEPEPEYRD